MILENATKLCQHVIEYIREGQAVANKIKNGNAERAIRIERLYLEIINEIESEFSKVSSIEINMNNILADQEIINDDTNNKLASFKMLYSNNGSAMFFDILDNMMRCAGFVKLLENASKEVTDMCNSINEDCRNLMSIIGEVR